MSKAIPECLTRFLWTIIHSSMYLFRLWFYQTIKRHLKWAFTLSWLHEKVSLKIIRQERITIRDNEIKFQSSRSLKWFVLFRLELLPLLSVMNDVNCMIEICGLCWFGYWAFEMESHPFGGIFQASCQFIGNCPIGMEYTARCSLVQNSAGEAVPDVRGFQRRVKFISNAAINFESQ